ncbi:Gfo/Idh/MocA family protein [Synoicihabitans lomoniglobus]|uniref:Gfo/Idh/MocA family oxidoreductase n=1 Tax=Synoicihabitans lomoniglobus TaxID=2909285 RepID=A0AAF0I390_9BACT|nr:Gfo/Idh/MocA family oxidoreductase [Opitutaceae bacterium LMO-M01]WED65775.1 Gfo/Idh/MocA family oxidoreductase [Opitutaceae bacterium LMO-M01]
MSSPLDLSAVSRRAFLRTASFTAAALSLPRGLLAVTGSDRKLGVVLVGLGNYATHQLGPALRETQHCRLVGVVTGDAAKGAQWARDYGFPASSIYDYDTMDRMADNPDIDIVYAVTPNALHAEHCIKAAQAGKHVVSEKPFTVSVAEADQVIAACQKQDVKLSLGYRLHFDPYHAELRRLAASEEFGPFARMDGNFSFVMRNPQWRAEHGLAGGGPLMDLGVYIIQAALMAAGEQPPVAVTAKSLHKSRPEFFKDVEETLEWTMEFPRGERCRGYTSYNDNGNQFRAEAAKGWYQVGPAFGYRGLKASTSARGELSFPPFNQQAAQMDDFALCVKENRESKVNGEMGRRDMCIIEAIYRAMASGRRELVRYA